jgi:Skp family chaperone for outer membrane proteins
MKWLLVLTVLSWVSVAHAQSVPAQPNALAPAKTLPVPYIVVVDLQAVVVQSKAGQGVRQQHEKVLQGYESELQATRKDLSSEEAELTKQKNTMSMIDWQKKAQAFDVRLSAFNQKFNRINQAVDKSYIAAMNELGKSITQVTSEIATEMDANLVLPKAQVILHDPRMDLTKKVIERMDDKYPSVVFPAPDLQAVEPQNKGPDKSGKK